MPSSTSHCNGTSVLLRNLHGTYWEPCLLVPSLHPIKNPFGIRLIIKLVGKSNSITFLNARETPKSISNHFSIWSQGKLPERIRLWSPVGLTGVELQCLDWTETIVPDNSPPPSQGDTAACRRPRQDAGLCQEGEEKVSVFVSICVQTGASFIW